jgi:hypothetical protein
MRLPRLAIVRPTWRTYSAVSSGQHGNLCSVADGGSDIEPRWLDIGYGSEVTRRRLADGLLGDAIIAKKRKTGEVKGKNPQPTGTRWLVERTNSWLSNFGRDKDPRSTDRLVELSLAPLRSARLGG